MGWTNAGVNLERAQPGPMGSCVERHRVLQGPTDTGAVTSTGTVVILILLLVPVGCYWCWYASTGSQTAYWY